MRTFLEGLDAVRLPCTLALLVPAIAVTLMARQRAIVALGGFVIGASLIAWARFAGFWVDDPGTLAAVVVGVVLAAAALVLWRYGPERPEVVGPTALGIGGITAWLWQPCVGRQLGEIINNAGPNPYREILPMLAYVTGACLLAGLLVLLPTAVPQAAKLRDSDAAAGVGLALTLLIAAGVTVGLYDDLVAELVRVSIDRV